MSELQAEERGAEGRTGLCVGEGVTVGRDGCADLGNNGGLQTGPLPTPASEEDSTDIHRTSESHAHYAWASAFCPHSQSNIASVYDSGPMLTTTSMTGAVSQSLSGCAETPASRGPGQKSEGTRTGGNAFDGSEMGWLLQIGLPR